MIQNENETRQRLIRLIADHQFAHPGKKLQIGVLSEQCGISRQAFNRYHDDLKPYASGLKPIAELLSGADNAETSELLNQSHSTLLELNKKLAMQEKHFEAEKEKIVAAYVTSLMNDDITKFNTNELRQTLERTVIHSEKLSRQVDNLKIELIKEQQKALTAQAPKPSAPPNKTIIDPDLSRVFDAYSRTGDDDKFETDKQAALDLALEQVNRMCMTADTVVVVFAERYLSSFQRFADSYSPHSSKAHVILRLPVFNRTFFTAIIKKIKASSIHVFVPVCDNQGIRKAQRAFSFRSIPEDEIKSADAAHAISTGSKIESVCTFQIKQGD
ncbi:hypothetical protein [Pseudomonas viridiflava]|uniref:hypothetical protein n=1 Tax=Pseudomonas viridiflava TaxID=33069 RepID=UPI000F03BE3D|nr:hypothetical protein [Pseudomonas viridiflava]